MVLLIEYKKYRDMSSYQKIVSIEKLRGIDFLVVIGATLILLLRQSCGNRFFIRLGSYTYSIYLFHQLKDYID